MGRRYFAFYFFRNIYVFSSSEVKMSVQNMHAYRSFGLKFVWIGRGDTRPLARARSAAP